MKAGGGHGKGASFERVIAKAIIKAYKRFGVTQRDCWRSTLSGGHARSAGDLEMTERMEGLFPFCVECKFHKRIEWWRFLVPLPLRKKSWKEMQWLEQTLEGARKRHGLAPALVMKENSRPILVMVYMKKLSGEDMGWTVWFWKDFLKFAVKKAKMQKGKAA